jgi:hypothetical protein
VYANGGLKYCVAATLFPSGKVSYLRMLAKAADDVRRELLEQAAQPDPWNVP